MAFKVFFSGLVLFFSCQSFAQGSLQATANYARTNASTEEYVVSYWWATAVWKIQEEIDTDKDLRDQIKELEELAWLPSAANCEFAG